MGFVLEKHALVQPVVSTLKNKDITVIFSQVLDMILDSHILYRLL